MKNPLIVSLLSFLFVTGIYAGPNLYDEPPGHGNEKGFSLDLSMSGLGIGGFYRKAMPAFSHLGVSLDFFIMRGDREFQYYDPYLGYYIQRNNFNQLFLIPLNFEFKKRLFPHDIEESFRPHVIAKIGTIFGMNFPDKDAYRYYPEVPPNNEYQFTYNFVLGLGVDIGGRDNYFISIRPQYRYVFFPETIASKKNHSAFEIKVEIGGRSIK